MEPIIESETVYEAENMLADIVSVKDIEYVKMEEWDKVAESEFETVNVLDSVKESIGNMYSAIVEFRLTFNPPNDSLPYPDGTITVVAWTFRNAFLPMLGSFSPSKYIHFSRLQFSNADSPIAETLSPMVTPNLNINKMNYNQ